MVTPPGEHARTATLSATHRAPRLPDVHIWFEDRRPQCTLLVYIDDATSELMHLKMVECVQLRPHGGNARVYRAAWQRQISAKNTNFSPFVIPWSQQHDRDHDEKSEAAFGNESKPALLRI
ncbi:hypothetical protein [Novosphingobium sp. G106]|uniref:hypothetical protein n=1 Tax=Novosphingobium sp. G106 TaxID=2849500 RepID=UPI0035C7D5EE